MDRGGGSGNGSGSGVKIVSECFVEPHHGLQKPTPPFHLTPWDANLMNFHFHIQNGLLFAGKPPEMKTLLENLKSSLSLTLLHFYPVAGRIRAIKHINDNDNEILILSHENEKEAVDADAGVSYSYHVDCNNSPGVKFIHGISLHKDFGVSDLLHSQSPSDDDDVPAGVLQSLFMDDRDVNDLESKSLLTITVVELVDGISLGCSMNHIVADGNSFCHFLSMWSHIFQQQQQQQNIITIARPPMLERWFPDGHRPALKVPFALRSYDSFTIPQPPPRRARIFHLSSHATANLKAKAIADLIATNNNPNANGDIHKISSFQALSAFLWRTITQVRNLPPDRTILFVSPVNNRSRLDPPLPAEYFGNAAGMVAVITTAGELLSNNLGWAAWKLHQAVVNYDDTQVRQWLRDWLKSPRCLMPDEQMQLCSVVVNDFTKFSTVGNEFGILGKPLSFYFGNRSRMSDGNVCACSGREHGSIALDVCLSPDAMSRLLSHKHFMEAVG